MGFELTSRELSPLCGAVLARVPMRWSCRAVQVRPGEAFDDPPRSRCTGGFARPRGEGSNAANSARWPFNTDRRHRNWAPSLGRGSGTDRRRPLPRLGFGIIGTDPIPCMCIAVAISGADLSWSISRSDLHCRKPPPFIRCDEVAGQNLRVWLPGDLLAKRDRQNLRREGPD